MAQDEHLNILILVTLLLGYHAVISAHMTHGRSRTYRETQDTKSSIILSRENYFGSENETFLVICKDRAGRQVGWKGPRGSLGPKTHPTVHSASYGTALIFNRSRTDDSGNYTCSQTSRPQEKKIFSLKVEDKKSLPPTTEPEQYTHKPYYTPEETLKFVDTNDVQTTREFTDAVVRCTANLKAVEITWLMGNGEKLNLGPDSRYMQIGDGLLIKNVTREDAQTYVCQAHHLSSGNILTQNITLIVQHKPSHVGYEVYAEAVIVYACLGDQVNLTCEVEAEPPPKFVWHHNKKGEVLEVSSHKSVLRLTVSETSQGTYKCKASNELGKLEIFFDLKLGEKPNSPLNVTLLEVMPDSLQLKIYPPSTQLNGTMEPRWFVVEYRPESTEEWHRQEFNSSLDTVLLKDLETNTKYELRAATKNVACLSEFTNQTVVTTSGQKKLLVFNFMIATLLILTLNF